MCVKNVKPLTKWCLNKQLPWKSLSGVKAFNPKHCRPSTRGNRAYELTSRWFNYNNNNNNKTTANVAIACAITNRSKIQKRKAMTWITKDLREMYIACSKFSRQDIEKNCLSRKCSICPFNKSLKFSWDIIAKSLLIQFKALLNPFWNHWFSLQSDWLSVVRFIHESHHFSL